MRIGIVSTWFERGAGYVSRQFKEILEREFEVLVYARGGEYPKGNAVWDTPEVTWGRRNGISSTAIDLRDFERWLDRNSIDVVFFNEQKWWDPILLCNRKGIINGAYIDYYTEETIPIYGLHDFLICNTKKHYQAFDWHQGAHYVPWGTNTKLFSPERAHEFVHEMFPDVIKSLKGKTVFFQSVGVVPYRKGTDLLLRAFAQVDVSAAHLLLHCQIRLRTELPDLSALIDSLVDSGRLTLIEETVSAPGLYGLADVYVYPSRLEGIGLTVPEALSSGLPVIVPNEGPMNEFITPECGIAVKPVKYFARSDAYYWPQNEVDPRELASAMKEYVTGTRDIEAAKTAARRHAERSLDWSINASGVVDIFRSVTRISETIKRPATEAALRYNKRRKVRLKEAIRRIPVLRRLI